MADESLDIGKKITDDINDLIQRSQDGSLSNIDFTRVWTDIVALPMIRLEQIVKSSEHTRHGYDINQAMIYGLMVRIDKYLAYSRRITCKQLNNMDIASLIQRAIMEDNIRLQYFISNPTQIENYRKSSVRTERDYEEWIYKNRKSRSGSDDGQIFDWEEGLLDSIRKTYDRAGVSSGEKLPGRTQSIKDMAKAVGLEDLYVPYQVECHSVHGDWVSISRNFIREENGLFYPCFDDEDIDIRKLNPITLVCYLSMKLFIQKYPGHGIDVAILDELDKDMKLIMNFDMMHDNFIHERPLLDGVVFD